MISLVTLLAHRQVVFLVWVSLTEQKRVILGERRRIDAIMTARPALAFVALMLTQPAIAARPLPQPTVDWQAMIPAIRAVLRSESGRNPEFRAVEEHHSIRIGKNSRCHRRGRFRSSRLSGHWWSIYRRTDCDASRARHAGPCVVQGPRWKGLTYRICRGRFGDAYRRRRTAATRTFYLFYPLRVQRKCTSGTRTPRRSITTSE